MSENILLVPFYTDSLDFALGFEAGSMYRRIENCDEIINHPVHKENEPFYQELTNAFPIEIMLEPYDDEWSYLTVKSKKI